MKRVSELSTQVLNLIPVFHLFAISFNLDQEMFVQFTPPVPKYTGIITMSFI